MKRNAKDLKRLIRTVEQLRRREELALIAERKRGTDALAAIGRVYQAAGEDLRQAATRFALYGGHLAGLSQRRSASEERAGDLVGAVQLADGRLKALGRAYNTVADMEERRRVERELTERVALVAVPATGKGEGAS